MKNKNYRLNPKEYKSRVLDRLDFYEEAEFSKEFIDLIDPYFGRLNHVGIFDEIEKIKKL